MCLCLGHCCWAGYEKITLRAGEDLLGTGWNTLLLVWLQWAQQRRGSTWFQYEASFFQFLPFSYFMEGRGKWSSLRTFLILLRVKRKLCWGLQKARCVLNREIWSLWLLSAEGSGCGCWEQLRHLNADVMLGCRRQLLGASSMVKGEVAELRWSLQLWLYENPTLPSLGILPSSIFQKRKGGTWVEA